MKTILLNEFKKMISLKSVWIFYLLGMTFLCLLIYTGDIGENGELALEIVKTDSGPYNKDYVIRMGDFLNEIENKCGAINPNTQTVYTVEELHTCMEENIDSQYGDLITLYAGYTFDEYEMGFEQFLYTKNMITPIPSYNIKEFSLNWFDLYFKKMEVENYTNYLNSIKQSNQIEVIPMLITQAFMDNALMFYFASIVSIGLLIISISYLFAIDNETNVNYLILSSKKGRKIIKTKLKSIILIALFYTSIVFIPFFLMFIFHYKLNIVMFHQVNELFSYQNFWVNTNTFLMLFLLFILIVFSHIMISVIVSFISVLSKHLLNAIVYNILLMAATISYLVFQPNKGITDGIIKFILIHTPYGFVKTNISLLQYQISEDYSYNYVHSYLYYPITFIIINTLLGLGICFTMIKYSYRQNL